MRRFTLLTKSDCPPCEDAKYILETLQKYKNFELEVINITSNLKKYNTYIDNIPVLLFNDVVICYQKLDMAKLVPLIETGDSFKL